jgi:N-acetylglucosaminyldiphosphoundecaprenol N-acetyl-beta-D-mannosaminyltransferase
LLIKSNILTLSVDVLNVPLAVEQVVALAKQKAPAYVCASNVHMCMETFDNKEFRDIISHASLVVADGRPIYWAQKLLGFKQAQQVRGQDLMTELCAQSANQELNIGLYGGSSNKVLVKVISNLKHLFPNVRISYQFSPPFTELSATEITNVLANIKSANVDILFVGIGCPKQERWMAQNSPELPCVMVGVGAAFDFIAGEKKHAPKWMQKLGLEWFFRMITEPKRLAVRYLKENPRFVYYFLRQVLKNSMLDI